MKFEPNHEGHEECDECRFDLPFELPEEFFEKLINREVVFFLGAGVSTEARRVYPYSLYDDVRGELADNIPEDLPFPDLMEAFCAEPGGRIKLLRMIRDRFQYVDSFPELYRAATRFHREIATIPFVETFITTNWDTYIEDECGAIPFITAEDFAFSEIPGRKVFKLHGSARSLGSIVATRGDYDACYQRLNTGLLGSKLKVLLATKTVVYIGFSFRDDDFSRIHNALTAEMRGLRPQAYFVTIDPHATDNLETGINSIRTDGTFFISKIKEKLVADCQMLSDERFLAIPDQLDVVAGVHRATAAIRHTKFPDNMFSLCYQDGLFHAFERILSLKKTGYYSDPLSVTKIAKRYEFDLRVNKIREQKFHDVAYIDGYVNGLIYLLANDHVRKEIPLYYAFGTGKAIKSRQQYLKVLRRLLNSSSKTHRWAAKVVASRDGSAKLDIHHTPFLL